MKAKTESCHNRRSIRQVEESSNFRSLTTQVMNFSHETWCQKMQEDTGRCPIYAQTFSSGLKEKVRQQQSEDEAVVQIEYGEDGE